MTTDNEALKLANSVPELQSLLYDVDLMPEQLDPTGFGYRRMLAIVEAYKVGIQAGRDQVLKELAEQEPVAWGVFGWFPDDGGWCLQFPNYSDKVSASKAAIETIFADGNNGDWKIEALIPQPTMPNTTVAKEE